MIIMKGKLNKKEQQEVELLLGELTDIFGDFYITRSNLRLFIKENTHLLYELLQKGDKIAYSEEEGIALIIGWSDKSPRKYLKVLARNDKTADKLIKIVNWRIKEELYVKVKKNNPLLKILQKNNFRFLGDRGKEILLVRTGQKEK